VTRFLKKKHFLELISFALDVIITTKASFQQIITPMRQQTFGLQDAKV